MFGQSQPIELVLLDIEVMMGVLNGVVMELMDCALPLLSQVQALSNVEEAFKGVQVAILVGAMPRREGMERKDLLKANVKIFKQQGEALNKFADKNVKVVVVGNPANTNACIAMINAPEIPKENFTCLTRLDQNRACAQIASKVQVSCQDVENAIIWGNHSSTQYPDINHAVVKKGDSKLSVSEAVSDDNWLKNEFISTVQKRGAAVIAARKLSSAMSAAKAICDHMRDWWQGTKGDSWVSMGVHSDGSYGIEKGLIYSFPVRIADKKWTIVQDLPISNFAREKMDLTMKELQAELTDAKASTTD